MGELLWQLLGFVVLPLWLLSGLTDYATHRRSDIEHTSGITENLLHLAQTAQVGMAVLILLFAKLNILAFALMALCVAVHTATAYADLRYTIGRRHISAIEQMAHGFLLVLPLMGLAIVAVLHWPELALHEAGAWTLAVRATPFPVDRIVAVLAASLAFGVGPGIWELLRSLRALRAAPDKARSALSRGDNR